MASGIALNSPGGAPKTTDLIRSFWRDPVIACAYLHFDSLAFGILFEHSEKLAWNRRPTLAVYRRELLDIG